MKEQTRIGLSAGIPLLLFTGALLVETFAPSPYKQWGGAVVLVLAASVLVTRSIQTITGKPSMEWVPYIVATYLVLVPILVFTSGMLQLVAGIVFASLTGAAGFYWIVAIIVDEVKKIGRKEG